MAARKRTKTFPQPCWSTCGGTKMRKNVTSAMLEHVWRYENAQKRYLSHAGARMAAQKCTKTLPQPCWSTCGGTKTHKNVTSAMLEHVWRHENAQKRSLSRAGACVAARKRNKVSGKCRRRYIFPEPSLCDPSHRKRRAPPSYMAEGGHRFRKYIPSPRASLKC